MVSTILTAFALFIMVLCVFVLFERWQYEKEQKRKWREREAKRPKAMRKAEYDCTENFYHD